MRGTANAPVNPEFHEFSTLSEIYQPLLAAERVYDEEGDYHQTISIVNNDDALENFNSVYWIYLKTYTDSGEVWLSVGTQTCSQMVYANGNDVLDLTLTTAVPCTELTEEEIDKLRVRQSEFSAALRDAAPEGMLIYFEENYDAPRASGEYIIGRYNP